jgi:multimeric flavodoxin WrbA
MTSIAIVFHSQTGRTRALAEAVARGAAESEEVVAHLIAVEDASKAHDVLAAADAIVFGTPTYMGSASAQFKAFMDTTSAIWALQGWRDKLAAGFTHSAAPSGDKLGTLTQLAVFAAQHGMVWVGLGLPPSYVAADVGGGDLNRLGSHLGAMAQSRPGGGELPIGDVKTAEHLGRRVAMATLRWRLTSRKAPSVGHSASRHAAARGWSFPPPARPPLGDGLVRVNLRELASREGRFEHHLVVVATIDGAQLEITTASEPLYFAHINWSDEYAIALPSGDELVDRFPLRTFLTNPKTNEDVGRYNHRTGDLVLHPVGLLHWPGRLRPPYEPFDFPPGMRRAGLSLVYCASAPTPSSWVPVPPSSDRAPDAKAYVEPAPPMMIASTRGRPGDIARIGRTSLELVEVPTSIAPPKGGWVVVLEADPNGPHAACDLVRIAKGAKLAGDGIARALVLSADSAEPDEPPPTWLELPPQPFAPFEDNAPGSLPFEAHGIRVTEAAAGNVKIAIGERSTEAPRFWLARMLFRIALHKLRLGYVETYGGAFVDDRGVAVRVGFRLSKQTEEAATLVPRDEAMAFIELFYRAVAPTGYRERPP